MSKNNTKNYFNKFGENLIIKKKMHRSREGYENILRTVLQTLIEYKAKTVLEIGCGLGELSELAKKYSIDYIGIDISEKLISKARLKFPNTKFIVGDVNNLPFENRIFDSIISINVLHHCEDPVELLKSMRFLLGDHGKVIAVEPNFFSIYQILGWIKNYHIDKNARYYNRFFMKNTFKEAGYKNIKIKHVNIFPHFFDHKLFTPVYRFFEKFSNNILIKEFSTYIQITGTKN